MNEVCHNIIIINALLSLVMRLYTRVLEIFDQFMIQTELFANHTYKQWREMDIIHAAYNKCAHQPVLVYSWFVPLLFA